MGLCALALLCAAASGARAQEALDPRDELLRWEGDRYGTLGPTGRRLFAARLDVAPGMRGRFGLGDLEAPLDDPLVLEVRAGGRPAALRLEELSWFPSHQRAVWRADGLRVEERKAITSGDALLLFLELSNEAEEPLDLSLHLSGGAAPLLERTLSDHRRVDLSPAANLAPITGRRAFTAGPPTRRVWVEGEAALVVGGGAGPERRAGASGGACLSSEKGIEEGDGARWLLVAPPLAEPVLVARYAHGGEGAVALSVSIDGVSAGVLELTATGGDDEWGFAELSLPALAPGLRRFELRTARAGSSFRLDGFFVLVGGTELPVLPEGGSYPDAVPEQVLLPPGVLELDAVPHVLPDSGAEQRPTCIALRGGVEGDPARALPARVELELPDLGRGRAELHVLCALAMPRGSGAGAPAEVRLAFDDGSSAVLPWPRAADLPARLPARVGEGELVAVGDGSPRVRGDQVEWRAFALPGVPGQALQLAYTPPPGRFLQRLELFDGGGPEVPLILAATVELLPATGHVPVLLGRRELPGASVELALAGDGFVPEVDARGGRTLVRHLSLEPGEARRLHVGLQCGPRPFQTALAALALVEDAGAFDAHLTEWWRWFDEEVPGFTCSDPLLERAWLYRFYLLRHDMLRLDLPSFALPVFYRGLSTAELCVVHPAATANVLADARWLRDPEIALGQVRALVFGQGPDGLLRTTGLRGSGPPAPQRVAAAAWEAYLVNGSRSFLAEVVPLLERGLWSELARFDADGNGLPEGPPAAGAAGWPSACPHFENGLDGPQERVELAAHAFASARALAAAQRELGEPEAAERLESLAARIGAAVLARTWSESEGRFRAVRASDGEPVRCRELYDLLPFGAGLVPDRPRYAAALAALVDPASLRTPAPFAAAAPAEGAGPPCAGAWVFPAADTAAADVLARALRREPPSPVSPADLARFLSDFARLHFEAGDPSRAVLRERYDPLTGLGMGEPDVLDSAFADLLIRFVGGLVPRADGTVELDPLVPDLEHFRFRRLPYHGRLLDIAWDRPDGTRVVPAVPEGLALWIDGELVAHSPNLERLVVELPPGD